MEITLTRDGAALLRPVAPALGFAPVATFDEALLGVRGFAKPR